MHTQPQTPWIPLPPPPTNIRRRNPRDQGRIGVGDAIAWFMAHGYVVSIPVEDSQPYDIIVDDGQCLLRVQVKTTTRRSPRGAFMVQLETRGGNQSFHTGKPFAHDASDLLYVLTDVGERYLIPTDAFEARHSLTMGARMARFRL